MNTYKTIAESNNFIVLDNYIKDSVVNEPPAVYQTEAALESEFIHFLAFAKGSKAELETQLLLCVKINYLNNSNILYHIWN